MKDSELIERLKQASQGLLWLSESDYPFEVIYWENVDDIKAKLGVRVAIVPILTLRLKPLPCKRFINPFFDTISCII